MEQKPWRCAGCLCWNWRWGDYEQYTHYQKYPASHVGCFRDCGPRAVQPTMVPAVVECYRIDDGDDDNVMDYQDYLMQGQGGAGDHNQHMASQKYMEYFPADAKFDKCSDKLPDIKERIDVTVFSGFQGGPHDHQIGDIAAQLVEMSSPEFKGYSQAVMANADTRAKTLQPKSHELVSDGTDNHVVLRDLRPHGLTGSKLEKVCEHNHWYMDYQRYTAGADAEGNKRESLHGLRAGTIFFNYGDKMPHIKDHIDMAVSPGLQGGPHNHQIGDQQYMYYQQRMPDARGGLGGGGDYGQQYIDYPTYMQCCTGGG